MTAPVPLSRQQEFLNLVDRGDDSGPFGPRYTIVGGWRITGPLHVEALREALGDVVARHETLRTVLVRDPVSGHAHQRVGQPVRPSLRIVELSAAASAANAADRDAAAEELVDDVEAQPQPINENPLVRAVLGRFDERDSVLVISAHHTGVDGWSIQVMMRDLARFYATRTGATPAPLRPVPQYREYVAWQRAALGSAAAARARDQWRQHLHGARILPIPLDCPRSVQGPGPTSWHRGVLGADVADRIRPVAAGCRASPFMVLLAAYVHHLGELTGEQDIVVSTFTPGRRPAWTEQMVGSFFNLLPLRITLAGVTSFAELVGRVRAECLDAYRRELPFLDILAAAPDLMSAATGENHASWTFQLVQSPFMARGERVGELTFRAMRRRVRSRDIGSQIPDGALWAVELDETGDLLSSVGYCRAQYAPATVTALVDGYRRTLAELLPPS